MKILGQKVTLIQWLTWKMRGREYFLNKISDK